jgi:capsular polysaccharide biosynthesis protein
MILRRWYILVPCLLMSIAAAGATFQMVPPRYETKIQLLLVPPNVPTSATSGPSNPYLNFGPGLLTTVDILALSVTSQDAASHVAAQGGSAEYRVSRDLNTSGPIVNVSAQDRDPSTATKTANLVVKLLETDLQAAQDRAGAPRSTWIAVQVLTQSPKPERLYKSAIQDALVVAVGGIFVSFALVYLLERRAERRRMTRGPSSHNDRDGKPRMHRPPDDRTPASASIPSEFSDADFNGVSGQATGAGIDEAFSDEVPLTVEHPRT